DRRRGGADPPARNPRDRRRWARRLRTRAGRRPAPHRARQRRAATPPYPRNARLGGRPSGGSPACGGGNGRGSATIEGRIAMGERVIIYIKTFADGHRPPDRVIGAML